LSHTIKVIAGGFVLLALCLLIGRWIGGPTPAAGLATAAKVFLGYSVAEEGRHTVDSRNNPRNFPALTFKSFKGLEFGSFLLKMEVNLDGSRNNASKIYTEVSQTLRFWKPSLFLHLEYTGGLGLSSGGTGGGGGATKGTTRKKSGRRTRFSGRGRGATSFSRTSTPTFPTRAMIRRSRSIGGKGFAAAGTSRRPRCCGRKTRTTAMPGR
jgi:hypothetical protein